MRRPFAIALALVACAAAVVWARRWYAYDRPIGVVAEAAVATIPDVPFFRQADPRWGADRLGRGPDTLAASGCTLCCLAMAVASIGVRTDPQALNQALIQAGGYDGAGNIIWAKVPLPPARQIGIATPSHAAIAASLQSGRPVLAKIRIMEGFVHWVLIVGAPASGRYAIHDPLAGSERAGFLDEITGQIDAIRVIR